MNLHQLEVPHGFPYLIQPGGLLLTVTVNPDQMFSNNVTFFLTAMLFNVNLIVKVNDNDANFTLKFNLKLFSTQTRTRAIRT